MIGANLKTVLAHRWIKKKEKNYISIDLRNLLIIMT